MSQKSLRTGDLDLDLQGQIGLQTWKIFVFSFLIDPCGILPLHLNCLLII